MEILVRERGRKHWGHSQGLWGAGLEGGQWCRSTFVGQSTVCLSAV